MWHPKWCSADCSPLLVLRGMFTPTRPLRYVHPYWYSVVCSPLLSSVGGSPLLVLCGVLTPTGALLYLHPLLGLCTLTPEGSLVLSPSWVEL